jgi:hypothetical protein
MKLESHSYAWSTQGADLSWDLELVVTIKDGSTRESLFLHHKGHCLCTVHEIDAEGVDDGIPVERGMERE